MQRATSDQNIAGNVGKALLDVPIGDMIVSLGQAIAAAQLSLDMNSLRTAQIMTGQFIDAQGEKYETKVNFDGQEYSLMELGFTPTFYQFTETAIEIKISISMSTEEMRAGFSLDLHSDAEVSGKIGFLSATATAKLNVSTVGASFASKFNYSAEGSSTIR